MLAMQYSVRLPQEYDLEKVYERVANRGPKFKGHPGLKHKFYLYDSEEHIYAPMYIWEDSGAAQEFLLNDLFSDVIQDFGRPRVRSWQILEFDYGPSSLESVSMITEMDKVCDTKKLGEISGTIKSYQAVLQLGEQTDTLDLDGKVVNSKPVPLLDKNLIKSVFKHFIGKHNQIPPMYSAKKVNGVRLYKLARQNKTINRKPVEVNIIDLTLNNIQDKQIDFSVTCSKGTYIRVLGQDIAKKLGTEGHLTKLMRISVGDFVVQDSIPLKEFETRWMSTEH